MSDSLICTFTGVGLQALVNAQNDGLQGVIDHLAVGRGAAAAGGTFTGYAPTAADTALRNEAVRVPILASARLDASAGFRLLATVPASSLLEEYWIREVAAILSDGTVLAIWADPVHPLAGKTATTDVDLSYDLILDGIPANLLTVTVLEPDIPDTTTVLAELLAGQAQLTTNGMATEERLRARGI